VEASFGLQRRLLLAGAALSLAMSIWGKHFVGMLAAQLPTAVDYVVLPTLLSLFICVLVVGFAMFIASAPPRTVRSLAVAAFAMGIGIASMHYVGMRAIHASVHLSHAPGFVVASFIVAIAASALAMWLAFGATRRSPLLICAAVLGLAISGMHYTAMAGLSLHPNTASGPSPPEADKNGCRWSLDGPPLADQVVPLQRLREPLVDRGHSLQFGQTGGQCHSGGFSARATGRPAAEQNHR
jgi:diguanylate cyclase